MLDAALEGRYFIFEFSSDYTQEGSGLAILRVDHGRLVEVWHPVDQNHALCGFENSIDGVLNRMARDFLKEKGIKEVFTLGNGRFRCRAPETFLGHTLDYDENENCWFIYEPLDPDSCSWARFLKEGGVELKFYDTDKLK